MRRGEEPIDVVKDGRRVLLTLLFPPAPGEGEVSDDRWRSLEARRWFVLPESRMLGFLDAAAPSPSSETYPPGAPPAAARLRSDPAAPPAGAVMADREEVDVCRSRGMTVGGAPKPSDDGVDGCACICCC